MQNTDIQLRCKKNVQRLKDFFVAQLGASSVRCLTLQPAAQRPLTFGGSVALQVRISDRRCVCRNRVIFLGVASVDPDTPPAAGSKGHHIIGTKGARIQPLRYPFCSCDTGSSALSKATRSVLGK